ncbi:MAG TPA: type II secretion system protein GspE, partial [Hyphomonas atlantica]|nr:type II secretion system protein GspE [Hyphomonas atlantica]
CGNTGFDGRIGIYELLTVDHEIRDLLGSEASEHQIDEAAFSVHDRLIDNARRYVVSQDTSPAEVLRVCRKGGA